MRSEIQSLDKTVWLEHVTTVEQLLREVGSQRRFQTSLLSLFAVVALLLAAIGIYGVMHHSVILRRHEIGIRIALGAQPRDVLGMVIRRGLVLALVGVAAGSVGALSLTRILSSLLFGVTATDPVTFAGVALVLLGVAMAASYVPARRATKIDPIVATEV